MYNLMTTTSFFQTDRIEEKQTSNEPLLSSSASSFNSVEKEDAGLYVVVKISIPEQKLTVGNHMLRLCLKNAFIRNALRI